MSSALPDSVAREIVRLIMAAGSLKLSTIVCQLVFIWVILPFD